MDFSNAGATERIGDAFRAHINWRVGGKQRNAYGPRRPDEDAAKDDLDAMRAVASGMSREDGFAAMAAEAERLKAGKPPSKQGSVEHLGDGYRARVDWRATGEMRQVHGPRRAEEKRAQADLEAMREAASMHDDVLQSRIAIFIRARYLQQQAEAERRVELFAHRRDKAQRAAEEEECDSGSDNSHMDFEAYEELGEEDDGMVDYAWKSSAELPLPLQAALRCRGHCRSTLSGLRKAPSGTSLAMYPSVDFALQAQGYVSKGRSSLSDAPFGRFSLPHPGIRQEGTALA